MNPATLAATERRRAPRTCLEAVADARAVHTAVYADAVAGFTFFLGSHRPPWLDAAVWAGVGYRMPPLCLSYQTMRARIELPTAGGQWMLDSGGFTELSKHGTWTITAQQYARDAQRYQQEIGRLVFAAQQDWMCEEEVPAKTGLTIPQHQRRTVDNYLALRAIAPDVRWAPTLQGWSQGDYMDHIDLFYAAGVELHALPRVCVGTVCKRKRRYLMQSALTLRAIHREGLHNLHAFGAHLDLLKLCSDVLVSSDSTAWSTNARAEHRAKAWALANATGAPVERGAGTQNDPRAACAWYHQAAIPSVRKGRAL
jgi:hypothetical protein